LIWQFVLVLALVDREQRSLRWTVLRKRCCWAPHRARVPGGRRHCGFLLPRMNGTFGRADWVANGILFAAYHLHVPWTIPINLVDTP
jgi:hypothetical protein